MRPECIAATERAIGRALSAIEVKKIESRIMQAMRRLSAEDPDKWGAMTKDERLIAAGERASADLIHEANLRARRTELQITKTAQLLDFVRAGDSPMEAFDRLGDRIAFNSANKSGVTSVEKEAAAVSNPMIGKLVSDPEFVGLMKSPEGIEAVTRELHGERTGNAAAKRIADTFHAEAETARQRMNRNGGDIGHLESWAAPQHHSQMRVAMAGLEKWVRDILPRLDRTKYVDENGVPMSDAQLADFLRYAFDSIATDGANKVTPGTFSGSGSRANRGSASRALHFKDADAFMEYQGLYGDKPMADVLIAHLRGIGKDIALVEAFGPNPDHTVRLALDTVSTEAKLANPAKIGKVDKAAGRVQGLYNELAGKQMPVASLRMAAFFDAMRSHLVSSKLGSAFITSFSDEATIAATAQANNLSYLDVFHRELATLNPANPMEKRMAMRAGLALNVVLQDLNRFASDQMEFNYIGDGAMDRAVAGYSRASKQAAHTVMKLSGLPLITEARKRAFGTVMMDSLGSLTREFDSFSKLDPKDAAMLKAKGVDESHWSVWRLAEGEDWGGGHDRVLTAESIYAIPDAKLAALGDPQTLREQAAKKLLAHVLEEVDMAVIEPGVRERSWLINQQRGTLTGELARSAMLFKTFPLAMLTRHWNRVLNGEAGNRALYVAAIAGMTTVIGGMTTQINELLNGRDPLDVTDPRFAAKAFMKGGAMGILGDFLYSDTTSHGSNSPAEILAGPLTGTFAEFDRLTRGNLLEAAQGKDTHAGGEAIRFFSGLTPGANLWYLKGALNHLFIHQIQEMASPGYLNRMESRAQRELGQHYWWGPGDAVPERAPRFEAMGGR
jgi:hypothetical protein